MVERTVRENDKSDYVDLLRREHHFVRALSPLLAFVILVICLDDETKSVEDAVTEGVRWPAVMPDPGIKLFAAIEA